MNVKSLLFDCIKAMALGRSALLKAKGRWEENGDTWEAREAQGAINSIDEAWLAVSTWYSQPQSGETVTNFGAEADGADGTWPPFEHDRE